MNRKILIISAFLFTAYTSTVTIYIYKLKKIFTSNEFDVLILDFKHVDGTEAAALEAIENFGDQAKIKYVKIPKVHAFAVRTYFKIDKAGTAAIKMNPSGEFSSYSFGFNDVSSFNDDISKYLFSLLQS